MEQLIAFIMDNFFIVLIVLGAIYSMFFRKTPVERPSNRMPDFGRGGNSRPGGTVESGSDNLQHSPSVPADPYLTASEHRVQQAAPLVESIMEFSHPAQGQVPSQQPPRKQASLIPQQPAQRSQPRGEISSLNSEDLARAVMWAEIIGPPRGKRPHRR